MIWPIFAQLVPRLLTSSLICTVSSGVMGFNLSAGHLRCSFHLSRHCLAERQNCLQCAAGSRSLKASAMSVQGSSTSASALPSLGGCSLGCCCCSRSFNSWNRRTMGLRASLSSVLQFPFVNSFPGGGFSSESSSASGSGSMFELDAPWCMFELGAPRRGCEFLGE